VRNRVFHGLATKKYFGKMLADRVLYVLLVLSLVQKASAKETDGKESEDKHQDDQDGQAISETQ
jgi:hypothetical protein